MSSTHAGHCQLCGSLQRLPKGVLSLHGYKVTHGFFSGVCRGAKHLPFEQAFDLVAEQVTMAQEALANLEARQARYRAPATKPFAVVNVFVKDSRGRTHHEWRRVEVLAMTRISGYIAFTYTRFPDEVSFGNRAPELNGDKWDETDVLAVATRYNTIYAGWLEHEAVSLRRYIAWQANRVATWQEQPLLALDAKKDKSAFKPEAPAYEVVDAIAD
jgi:hypothetical protein